jgi:hypothetical protein
MHKKLAADLTSLAHSILQMKDKEDVFALKEKAYEVYEKLSVLAYVEEYIKTTPNAEHSKEELLEKIEQAAEKKKQPVEAPKPEEEIVVHTLEDAEPVTDEVAEEIVEEVVEEKTTEVDEVTAEVEQDEPEVLELVVEPEVEVSEEEPEVIELAIEPETVEEDPEEIEVAITPEPQAEVSEVTEEPEDEVVKEIEEKVMELIDDVSSHVEEEVKETVESLKEEKKAPSLDEELKDTIAVDVVADLFENATKKSLNDRLHGDIQIGLNDRIAFVKNLFGGSQEDFNRVISQLNTFKTEKEAKKFLNKMVKPDYDWSEKEEYEERFMTIVERKFA